MRTRRLPVLAILLSSLAAGQEPAAKSQPKTGEGADPSPLIAALEAWAKAETAVLNGTSSKQMPEDPGDKANDRAGGIAFRVSGAMDWAGGGEEFKGAFEIVRRADGEAVFLSQAALPGFSHYLKCAQSLNRANYETRPPDAQRLVNDLFVLTQPADLIAAIKSAKLKAAAVDGAMWFRGELPAKLVRSNRPKGEEQGGMTFIGGGAKVLRIRTEFRVNAEGALAAMKWSVVRSDPAAAMRRRFREAAESGGDGTFAFAANDANAGADEEGATSIYELTCAGARPSDRAQAEIEALRALLAK